MIWYSVLGMHRAVVLLCDTTVSVESEMEMFLTLNSMPVVCQRKRTKGLVSFALRFMLLNMNRVSIKL